MAISSGGMGRGLGTPKGANSGPKKNVKTVSAIKPTGKKKRK